MSKDIQDELEKLCDGMSRINICSQLSYFLMNTSDDMGADLACMSGMLADSYYGIKKLGNYFE